MSLALEAHATMVGNPVVNPLPLGFEYVPSTLHDREEQLRCLVELFRTIHSAHPTARHAILIGPSGSGKTALARSVAKALRAAGAKQRAEVAVAHVNCRQRKTTTSVLIAILDQVCGGYPERGFSADELLRTLQRKLQASDKRLLIILDEADHLFETAGAEPFYLLTRINEESPIKPGASLLCLTRNKELPALLDDSASFFQAFTLQPYTEDALYAILQARASEALRHDAAPPAFLRGVAAASNGDARRAVNLLQAAAHHAAVAGVLSLTNALVEAAKPDPTVGLKPHLRYTFEAVKRSLGPDGTTITGRAEAAYRAVCAERGEEPRTHTMFWTYLNELAHLGIIETRRSSAGQRGGTTVIRII